MQEKLQDDPTSSLANIQYNPGHRKAGKSFETKERKTSFLKGRRKQGSTHLLHL